MAPTALISRGEGKKGKGGGRRRGWKGKEGSGREGRERKQKGGDTKETEGKGREEDGRGKKGAEGEQEAEGGSGEKQRQARRVREVFHYKLVCASSYVQARPLIHI